jgi:acetoin utilization protein AcuC
MMYNPLAAVSDTAVIYHEVFNERGFSRLTRSWERYRPQAIILQYGADGHYTDRMSGLKLSTRAYEYVAAQTHALAHRVCDGRLLAVGGGGYEPEVVERCWSILLAQLAGQKTVSADAYTALHDPVTDLPQPNPDSIVQSSQMLSLAKGVLDSMNLR